ncbi:uncharacterized protein [Physcomitrium patens]|uniref:THUMP domain-containing protein n=1 Tax=Physcomitrium patens TaxID=3218 RepID=A0A2K1JX43_PHYPA|nr:uncharacterized protein LOC112287295 [Physcomitrium patens]PNR46105.1 hypothetical protein PHYPA_013224 [Physcomitrium patens]|eukprot:XP_024385950.1 uncharacterized protein LOC112287295 [Physcomitrella patens]
MDAAALAPPPVGGNAGPDSSPPRSPALKPWDQHGGVINMPRYLYSSDAVPLLHRSGFLITCAYRREKSATKEAVEILREFLDFTKPNGGAKRARTESYSGSTQQNSLGLTKIEAQLRSPEERDTKVAEVERQSSSTGITGKLDGSNTDEGSPTAMEKNGFGMDHAETFTLSDRDTGLGCSSAPDMKGEFRLVKLARNGMVYISIPCRSAEDLFTSFIKIINDFHSRTRAAPRWCHRIFPAQVTCLWTKEDVQSNVITLVKTFIKGRDISSSSPLKYAVAVNKRGLEDKEKPGVTTASVFGKPECIHAVAEAIQSLTEYISVDLTNPQMVVMLELLPLVRVGTSVCAVSVLPRELVLTKPKLVIQALAPPKKQKK